MKRMFTPPSSRQPDATGRRGDGGRAAPSPAESGVDVGRVVAEVHTLRAGITQLGDQHVLTALGDVQRTLNALEGARAALIHEVTRRELHIGRGEFSAAETLTSVGAVRRSAARRLERESSALAECGEVAEALSDGSITSDQAAALATADVPEPVRRGLLTDSMSQNSDQTRQKVRQTEAAHRIENDLQRRNRQRAARQASMWIDDDGMWSLLAKLDPETGDHVKRRLERAIQREWRSDKELPVGRQRTVPQRAADALAGLLCGFGGPGAAEAQQDAYAASADAASTGAPTSETAGTGLAATGGRPFPFNDRNAQMIVTVGLECLREAAATACTCGRGSSKRRRGDRDSADGPHGPCTCADRGNRFGMTDAGTELTPSELRRMACDTSIIPAVMGAQREVLDVGRATRTIPPAIRRALIARDGGCVWPGCDIAPIGCVGHHLVHWVDFGPTSLGNLALLCRTHHNFLHKHGLDLRPPKGLLAATVDAPLVGERIGMAETLSGTLPPLTARERRAGRWTVIGPEPGCRAGAEILLPQRC